MAHAAAIAPDIAAHRDDFPVFSASVNGKDLVFLDTAASAQKPSIVLDHMRDFAAHHYANIHRGLYHLSQGATHEYESVRRKVAAFIGAHNECDVVFTRNATEGINLVAQSWGATNLIAGEEIIVTAMEHHANIVPWQMIAGKTGAVIKVIPVKDDGTLDLEAYAALLSEKTKMVAVVHASNALGTINPVARIAAMAKAHNENIRVLVDASQSVVHGGVDVEALGCDFLVFTGHKLYGPTGVGVLWGRSDILDAMPPYQGGGDMIERVSFDGTTFKPSPARFEAGTPAIVEVVGLGAAIDYVSGVGMAEIAAHEKKLLDYMLQSLDKVPGLTLYGRAQERVGVVSFAPEWAHISDVAMILDQCGVAVRSGHHCCMPLMQRFGIEGTLRASLGLYSNKADVDALVHGLHKAKDMLA